MTASSILVPQGSLSCLLPLQKTLKDQCIESESGFHIQPLHASFKRRISVSYSPLTFSYTCFSAMALSMPDVLVACLPRARSPSWETQFDEGQILCFLERTSTTVMIFLFVGHFYGSVGLDYTVHTSPTHLL